MAFTLILCSSGSLLIMSLSYFFDLNQIVYPQVILKSCSLFSLDSRTPTDPRQSKKYAPSQNFYIKLTL